MLLAGRFELEERAIDSGAMGMVYRARDRQSDRTVAVKLLRESGRENRERFLREAIALVKLRHPHVVEYVAHGDDEGKPYLVMEWIEGESLGKRLRRTELSLDEALELVACVSRAVAHAHRIGILHRDLKPSNVMLCGGEPRRPKVLDFGIARIGDGTTITTVGTMVGTPGYMSPEQARAQGGVGPPADVFALGCLLYRTVTGRPPFLAESVVATLAKVLFDEPLPIREIDPTLPTALDDLVRAMLEKDPARRFANAGEVATALEEIRKGSTPQARERRAGANVVVGHERKVVSVLLCTPEARSAPPGDTTTLHDDGGAAALVGIAREHGARVEAIRGGAIVATLTDLGAAKDLARIAARLALAMRAAAPDRRIGIATGRGEVEIRSAVGEAIDRAAQLARHEGIHVDDATAALAGDAFEIVGHALVGISKRTVRTVAGKVTPFVGRDRELATLDAVWNECTSEKAARVVLVSGAAGSGKSRLRAEWIARSREDEPILLLGRGDPVSAGSPNNLLAQCVRMGTHTNGLDAEATRARIADHLAIILPERSDAERCAEFMGELLGVGQAEGSIELVAARRDTMLLGDQIRRACIEWLDALAARSPIAIVLEDLHWGDLPTVRFIDEALRALGRRSLFVLAFARGEVTDVFPDLWAERNALVLRLGELGHASCEKLVRAVLPDADAGTVERIITRAMGNPLFLEELVRATNDGSNDIPDTLVLMMHARLDRFEPDARMILRAASVFGGAFWAGGVRALLGNDAAKVDLVLPTLVRREVVDRRASSRFPGDEEYAFHHVLVRDAAYDMLTDEGRSQGHHAAAQWLIAAGETDALALARHLELGGERSRAAQQFARAASRALAGNDVAGALDRALAGLACDPTRDVRAAIRFVQAEALRWKGDIVGAAAAAEDALVHAPAGSALRLAVAAELAAECLSLGKMVRVGELRDEVLQSQCDDRDARLAAIGRMAVAMLAAGRGDDASPLFAAIESTAVLHGDPMVRARIQQALAYRALFAGDVAAYREHTQEARASFLAIGDRRNACAQSANVGYATLALGDFAGAVVELEKCVAVAEPLGLERVLGVARVNLGQALAGLGRKDEGGRVLDAATADFVRRNDTRSACFARCHLALHWLDVGRLADARREAMLADRLGESVPHGHVFARCVLACVALATGNAFDAVVHARAAVNLAERLGAVEEGESLLRLTLARALLASGKEDEARQAIEVAAVRLRKRAARIQDAAARMSFLGNVPHNAATIELAERLSPHVGA